MNEVPLIMYHFDPEITEQLLRAGWRRDRSVIIEQWTQPLLKEGYRVSPHAVRALQNLGGLEVEPVIRPDQLFCPEKVHFNPLWGSGEFDRVRLWQNEFSLSLFLIGRATGIFILMIGDDGKVYSGTSGEFWMLGSNLETTLELLLLARRRSTRLISDGRILLTKEDFAQLDSKSNPTN